MQCASGGEGLSLVLSGLLNLRGHTLEMRKKKKEGNCFGHTQALQMPAA